jgi:hypothetical protein
MLEAELGLTLGVYSIHMIARIFRNVGWVRCRYFDDG